MSDLCVFPFFDISNLTTNYPGYSPYNSQIFVNMSTTASQDTRVQPWKAHWSPTQNESKSSLQYRADDSGNLLVDGVCTGPPGVRTGVLARSSKEDEAPKVRPWERLMNRLLNEMHRLTGWREEATNLLALASERRRSEWDRKAWNLRAYRERMACYVV